MSEPAPEPTTQPDPDLDEPAAADWKPPASQDEFNRIIEARVARTKAQFKDYNDLKSKASKYDELAEAQKTEQQKAAEARETAEKRAVEAESRALRLEVAHAKGLTPGQAKRLVGSTREEIEADADEILADFGAAGRGTTADQGVRGNPAPDMSQDMNFKLRQAAGRI